MFKLEVYCRRTLNTIPPRRGEHLRALVKPVVRTVPGIPTRASLRYGSEVRP